MRIVFDSNDDELNYIPAVFSTGPDRHTIPVVIFAIRISNTSVFRVLPFRRSFSDNRLSPRRFSFIFPLFNQTFPSIYVYAKMPTFVFRYFPVSEFVVRSTKIRQFVFDISRHLVFTALGVHTAVRYYKNVFVTLPSCTAKRESRSYGYR